LKRFINKKSTYSHTKLGRKITGGRYIKRMKKKKYALAGQGKTVKLSEEERRRSKRVRGGNKKDFMLRAKFVNVYLKNKKSKKVEIKNVLETPSNKFLARQNILTKGTVVQTELGKVRITNRPAQEGMINGILVE
jgi:small subunit ribosomal protein S8e